MSGKLNELYNLKTKEVSLVDKGANNKKRFPVFKKQENNMDKDILKAVLETDVDEEAGLLEWAQKSNVSEKGTTAAQAALRILSSFKDELSKETLAEVAKAAGFEFPKGDKEEEKKKKAKAEKEEDKDEMEKEVKKELDVSDDVKAHYEAVAKAQNEQIEALKTQNEKIEKALKDEKDTRRLEHWVLKSKESLAFVPNKTSDELAATFKQLEDVDPKLAEDHFESMKKMSDAVSKSALLEELGGRGLSSSSTLEKIEKGAEIYRQKANTNMSQEEAYDEYIQTPEGQALYAASEQEKNN
jgi:hypothetical protein